MGEVKKEEEKEEKRVNGKIRGNVEMLRGKRSVSWYGGKIGKVEYVFFKV